MIRDDIDEIFGRIGQAGNVALVYGIDAHPVTRLPETITPTVWPVGSDLSAYYEHAAGIVLTAEDASRIGVEIEGQATTQ